MIFVSKFEASVLASRLRPVRRLNISVCIFAVQIIARVKRRLSFRVIMVAAFRAVGTVTLMTIVAMDPTSLKRSAVGRYCNLHCVSKNAPTLKRYSSKL